LSSSPWPAFCRSVAKPRQFGHAIRRDCASSRVSSGNARATSIPRDSTWPCLAQRTAREKNTGRVASETAFRTWRTTCRQASTTRELDCQNAFGPPKAKGRRSCAAWQSGPGPRAWRGEESGLRFRLSAVREGSARGVRRYSPARGPARAGGSGGGAWRSRRAAAHGPPSGRATRGRARRAAAAYSRGSDRRRSRDFRLEDVHSVHDVTVRLESGARRARPVRPNKKRPASGSPLRRRYSARGPLPLWGPRACARAEQRLGANEVTSCAWQCLEGPGPEPRLEGRPV